MTLNKHVLTQSTVTGQLLVDLFHTLYVETAGLGMVHHGLGVVHTDYTFGQLLDAFWSIPGIIDVFGRKSPQDR